VRRREADGYPDTKKSRKGRCWKGKRQQRNENRAVDELGVHGSLLLETQDPRGRAGGVKERLKT